MRHNSRISGLHQSACGIFQHLEDCLIGLWKPGSNEETSGLENMENVSETKSENARFVILSYGEAVYYVNRVNVHLRDGENVYRAVFHAKRAMDNQQEDLDLEINKSMYNILVEYAKLDNADMILILHVEGNKSKWCLMSENWLKRYTNGSIAGKYVI
jgi:hypothetical protein